MRIAIRADASATIGTGHVMRQIAFAQHLLRENHEVTLFASIAGPEWLREYVKSHSELVWEEVPEGNFSADLLSTGDAFDALVVDAYTLNQKALGLLEKALPKVAVIIDGPWQDVRGKLAIAPTLEANPSWVDEYQKRFEEFHCGPQFFMLRQEVIRCSEERSSRSANLKPRIVVALGGSDVCGKTAEVVETLAGAFPAVGIDAFGSGRLSSAVGSRAERRVTFLPPGPDFLAKLELADVAVVGAGTTVAEVVFLKIPSIVIVVASNQLSNYQFIKRSALGVALLSEDPDFLGLLVVGVGELLSDSPDLFIRLSPDEPVIDALGSSRVRDIVFGVFQD